MKTVTFGKTTYIVAPGTGIPKDAVDPSDLSLKEQADLYNLVSANLNGKSIKAFKDKATGTARVIKILVAWEDFTATEVAGASPSKPTTPASPDAEKKPTHGINFLGMRVEIRSSDTVTPLTKKNTTLTRVLVLLLKGATMADLSAEFAAIDKERGRTSKRPVRIRVYEAIRCLCYVHGYGTRSRGEGDEATIKLVVSTPAAN